MSVVYKLNIFFLLVIVATFAEEDKSNKYWVYFEKPVNYSEASRCYKSNTNGKNSSIPAYNLVKEFNPQVISLDNISGKKIPRYTYCRFEIQIADSLEAHNTLGKFNNSSIVYDEMGYQQYDWAIKTEEIINKAKADSVCNDIKKKLKSSFTCFKNEETAFIVFGMDLTNEQANELIKKLNKKKIAATYSILEYVEIDL